MMLDLGVSRCLSRHVAKSIMISWLRASTGKHAGNQHFIGIRAAQALGNGVEAMESGHSNNLPRCILVVMRLQHWRLADPCGFVYPWKLELITTTRRDTFAARGKATTPLCSTSEIKPGSSRSQAPDRMSLRRHRIYIAGRYVPAK